MTVSCTEACFARLGAGVSASSAAAPRAAYCAASGGWSKNASYLCESRAAYVGKASSKHVTGNPILTAPTGGAFVKLQGIPAAEETHGSDAVRHDAGNANVVTFGHGMTPVEIAADQKIIKTPASRRWLRHVHSIDPYLCLPRYHLTPARPATSTATRSSIAARPATAASQVGTVVGM